MTSPLIETISQESGVHLYTVWLLFLIQAAKPAVAAYLEKGVPEEVVWETFRDLKFKVLECKNVQEFGVTSWPSGTPFSIPATL